MISYKQSCVFPKNCVSAAPTLETRKAAHVTDLLLMTQNLYDEGLDGPTAMIPSFINLWAPEFYI
jgi:hypothetical protein